MRIETGCFAISLFLFPIAPAFCSTAGTDDSCRYYYDVTLKSIPSTEPAFCGPIDFERVKIRKGLVAGLKDGLTAIGLSESALSELLKDAPGKMSDAQAAARLERISGIDKVIEKFNKDSGSRNMPPLHKETLNIWFPVEFGRGYKTTEKAREESEIRIVTKLVEWRLGGAKPLAPDERQAAAKKLAGEHLSKDGAKRALDLAKGRFEERGAQDISEVPGGSAASSARTAQSIAEAEQAAERARQTDGLPTRDVPPIESPPNKDPKPDIFHRWPGLLAAPLSAGAGTWLAGTLSNPAAGLIAGATGIGIAAGIVAMGMAEKKLGTPLPDRPELRATLKSVGLVGGALLGAGAVALTAPVLGPGIVIGAFAAGMAGGAAGGSLLPYAPEKLRSGWRRLKRGWAKEPPKTQADAAESAAAQAPPHAENPDTRR